MDSTESALLSKRAFLPSSARGDPSPNGSKQDGPAGKPLARHGWGPLLVLTAILLVGSLATGCEGTDSTESASDREAAVADTVEGLVQEMATAWSELEPEPYLELYSDDVQFYFRGSRSSRSELEKQVRDLMAGYKTYKIEPADPQIDVLGPGAAVASFRYKGRAVDTTGEAQDIPAAITLVYERRGGDWKIIQAHESVPPPEQSQ